MKVIDITLIKHVLLLLPLFFLIASVAALIAVALLLNSVTPPT